jgi:hypothetical protein
VDSDKAKAIQSMPTPKSEKRWGDSLGGWTILPDL